MSLCLGGVLLTARSTSLRMLQQLFGGHGMAEIKTLQPVTTNLPQIVAPYEHASIPAALRDWLGIPEAKMLPILRVRNAPTLGQILTLTKPRTKLPPISPPAAESKETATFLPANSLQRGLVAADTIRQGNDPHRVLSRVVARKDAVEYLSRPRASGNMLGSKT